METYKQPYEVRLGGHSLINMKKDVIERNNGINEKLTVTYTVEHGSSTCELLLVRGGRVVSKHGGGSSSTANRVAFGLFDHTCSDLSISFLVDRAENNLLNLSQNFVQNRATTMRLEQGYESYNRYGEIKRTYFHLYGNENKGGLLVKEVRIKNGDQNPFNVTVRHFYAATRGSVFSRQNRLDVGLSVVINIKVLNGELDCIVDGPDEHPSSALFYMFEQVIKTRTWNPMSCPHCANIQWQRNGFYLPSESEEEEDAGDKPPAPRYNANPPNFLNNEGSIKGKNNGNLLVRGLFVGRR